MCPRYLMGQFWPFYILCSHIPPQLIWAQPGMVDSPRAHTNRPSEISSLSLRAHLSKTNPPNTVPTTNDIELQQKDLVQNR